MRRFLKYLALIIGGLLLLGLAAYVVLDLVFSAQLRDTIAELKAKGRPMTVAEIVPPSVPDEQNAALPLNQLTNLISWAREDAGPINSLRFLLGIIVSNSFALSAPQVIATWSEPQRVEATRAVHSPEMTNLFDLVEEASKRPGFDNHFDYSAGAIIQLVYIFEHRSIIRLVACKAMVEAHEGQTAEALNTIVIGLRANNKLRQEPLLISQLVRLACDQILVDTLIGVVSTMDLPPEPAFQLTREMTLRQNETEVWIRALDVERVCFGMWAFESVMNKPSQAPEFAGFMEQPSMVKWLPAWILKPFLKKDYAIYLQLSEQTRRYFEAPYFMAAADEIRSPTLENQVPGYAILTSTVFPSILNVTAKIAHHQARSAVCQVGLALKLYRQKNGQYPETLDNLAPEFLETVPADPFTGRPLVYRKEGSGFVLYSLGADQKDDLGTPWSNKPRPSTNYDIVWACDR